MSIAFFRSFELCRIVLDTINKTYCQYIFKLPEQERIPCTFCQSVNSVFSGRAQKKEDVFSAASSCPLIIYKVWSG